MSDDKLTHDDDFVTLRQNTTGEPSEIARWDVPDGVTITLIEGQALVLQLLDAGGSELPGDTLFAFAVSDPDDPLDVGEFVTEEMQYRPWKNLSLTEQRRDDNKNARRVGFNDQVAAGGRVRVEEQDDIVLYVDSGTAIDTASITIDWPVGKQAQ